MTRALHWTEQAVSRLEEIHDYVARNNADAAARLIERLLDRAAALEQFPEVGRIVPEFPGGGLRELVEGSYRIVYRLRGQWVEVFTVFEAYRLSPVRDVIDTE